MESCCSRFTAAEGGARLAAAAGTRNLMITEHTNFIPTNLLIEYAHKIRGPLSKGYQRSVYLTRTSKIQCIAHELTILTDLQVMGVKEFDDIENWSEEIEIKQVLVSTSLVLKRVLEERFMNMFNINILIIDSCHLVFRDTNLQNIMQLYKDSDVDNRPRILAMTYPLFQSVKDNNTIIDEKVESNSDENIELNNDGDNNEINKINASDNEIDNKIIEQNEKNTVGINALEALDQNEKIDGNKDENESESIDSNKEPNEVTNAMEIIKTKIDNETSDDKNNEKAPQIIENFNDVSNPENDNIKSNSIVEDEVKDKNIVQVRTAEDMSLYVNLDDFHMYEKLEWKIEELEKLLCCDMDVAEDIDGGKRFGTCTELSPAVVKPKEVIIEFNTKVPEHLATDAFIDMDSFMRDTVNGAMDFINEHRYDPSEIYGDDLYEEFMSIPDPTIEPKSLFTQFLYVLDELGPYAADKAAFCLLTKLEKLKIKVPYERHFLLLCLSTSTFIKIRCYADQVFSKYESDWEKLTLFSTPKVLRFAEVLEQFQPETVANNEVNDDTTKINQNIHCLNRDKFRINNNESNLKIDDNKEKSEEKSEDHESLNGNKNTKNELDIIKGKCTAPNKNVDGSNEDKNLINDISENNDSTNLSRSKTSELLNELAKCDFSTLGDRIEDKMNIYQMNLKDIDQDEICDILPEPKLQCVQSDMLNTEKSDNNVVFDKIEIINNDLELANKTDTLVRNNPLDSEKDSLDCESVKIAFDSNIECRDTEMDKVKSDDASKVYKRGRAKGRGRPRHSARVQQLNVDSLCGIVFIKEPLMAKILFMLIVDMSRCRPSLSHLSAQYCAVETVDEPKESQRQGRKQEDVLKKFRMHECNLLLATSSLEEGIDLPRCNLVLRWDLPPTYRSYGLCRSRARAAKSSVSLLAKCDHHSELILHNLAVYKELDQIVTRKCGCGIQFEPTTEEEIEADIYTPIIQAYTPSRDIVNIIDKHSRDVKDTRDVNDKEVDGTCVVQSDNSVKYKEINEIDTTLDVKDIHSRDVKDTTGDSNDKDIDTTRLVKSDNSVKDIAINEIHTAIDVNKIQNNAVILATDKVTEYIVNEKQNDFNDNTKDRIKIEGVVKESDVKRLDDGNETKENAIMNSEMLNSDATKTDSEIYSDAFDTNNSLKPNSGSIKTKSGVTNSVGDTLDFRDASANIVINYSVENSEVASVDLNSAIALINRYCGKLPSDTFTRLAPQCWMEQVRLPTRTGLRTAYICTLRMPLNCPVKYNIVGHPMASRVLARRMVALQACRILHKSGELDDQLMPIGKENFKAVEMECNLQEREHGESARPGTTKRRQYYYKRTAWAFTDCQPIIDSTDAEIEADPTPVYVNPSVNKGTKRNMLYAIDSSLWCALPERYNTRGRKLHLPQNAKQAIGILVARWEPSKLQIPSFPVYTRSGEVRVSVELSPRADTRLSPSRARTIRRFMRFVFAEVLRVRRRGMRLQTDGSTQNNYYVVPTIKRTDPDGSVYIDIDWDFLDLIQQHTAEKKTQEDNVTWEETNEKRDTEKEVSKIDNPLLDAGEVFHFDVEKYREAVVTPWYRNQDQPQFFLVAEICWNLTPDSAFPSTHHETFRSYYRAKYGAELTQSHQPLLDVDHTSARLNLLTPRYVNRKGVALPVSSERTRRAKRDRLDQKQIMVPELCRVHPFASPLWFATMALPCVLYRINALLIADEIRRSVAVEVGLGVARLDDSTCPGFAWPPLDFGWSLAEVLNADSEKHEKKKEVTDSEGESETEKGNEEQQEKCEKEAAEVGKEKTLNDILHEKEEAENGFEIGTWSNEMATSIPQSTQQDGQLEPLPSNLTFCTTSATGGANWSEPVEKPRGYSSGRAFSMADSDCSYMSSDFDTDDSDTMSEVSDDDTDGFCNNRNTNAAMGVRIEYKTEHEAEAVDVERRCPLAPAPQPDPADDALDLRMHREILREGVPPKLYINKFKKSVEVHERVLGNEHFIARDKPIQDLLPSDKATYNKTPKVNINTELIANLDKIDQVVKEQNGHEVSLNSNLESNVDNKDENKVELAINKDDTDEKGYTEESNKNSNESKHTSNKQIVDSQLTDASHGTDVDKVEELFPYWDGVVDISGKVTLEAVERNKRKLLAQLKSSMTDEEIKKLNCFSMKDVDIDSKDYVNEKVANVGFDDKSKYEGVRGGKEFVPYYVDSKGHSGKEFNFDYQPVLEGHTGPSPSVILQALTMSNANDGINLERLETIGDSFLKFAITAYLYCAHPAVHEGKLSHMRSKQVSNLNLYRLGRNKRLGARMIASKFEPHDNWLPPCHKPPHTLHPTQADETQEKRGADMPIDSTGCFIPYNLITQHSIPDKSIADCVEALIGAYLLECGPRGALLFMSWLGIRVLPTHVVALPPHHPYSPAPAPTVQQKVPSKPYIPISSDSESCSSDEEMAPDVQPPSEDWSWAGRPVGSLRPYKNEHGQWVQPIFGELKAPPSPLLRYIEDPEGELERMLSGYEELECTLQYRFRDRSLLLQALTHASHHTNILTDCYQRLEFLGDAILDYLITRHLYEDPRRHSPGALTDLRSALVNNTIFATLAARHGFHKYFRHMSPGLNDVLMKYVKIQEENGHSISEEHYLIQEDEMEQAEDVEVPKALGDLFESVAGAIFLDSGMSVGAVWSSYARLMMAELEAFSAAAPKSPVRELLEAEPDTAKFGKPERLADGRRVRVCVEVFGRGTFKGIGRNYRIAKGTAARCALRHLAHCRT